jgi:type II secretory pathway pseudopilin PulG
MIGDVRRARSMAGRSRGFTLVEATVVLFVLGMMVLVFAGSVVMAEKAAHVNGDFSQALSVCQHMIDELRARGLGCLSHEELNDMGLVDDTPTDLSRLSFTSAEKLDDVSTGSYLPSATGKLAISFFAPGTKAALVTATVTWKRANHLTKTCSVSVSAIITNIHN